MRRLSSSGWGQRLMVFATTALPRAWREECPNPGCLIPRNIYASRESSLPCTSISGDVLDVAEELAESFQDGRRQGRLKDRFDIGF